MATEVFMPALGIAQDTGKLLEWLVQEGQTVQKGQPLMVIETDKTTVEIEAPASGILANVRARAGEDIPVGQVIAHILEAGETIPGAQAVAPLPPGTAKAASPVAARLAAEKGLDLSQVPSRGERVTKEDILAYLAGQAQTSSPAQRVLASPKARRLAQERGIALESLQGSGPQGAVLADDVLRAVESRPPLEAPAAPPIAEQRPSVSRMWKTMAKRMSESWRTVPHFFLESEVDATALVS